MGDLTQPTWTDYANERLASMGYRRGGGRSSVIELLDGQDCALSAQAIEDALRDSGRRVGRATIYRALEELTRVGLIAKVEIGDGVARYEAVFPDGAAHHHHLVCDSCRVLIPFTDDALERAIRRIGKRSAFAVDDHDVTLHGICSNCAG
jgi:Fur family ferric uptake transcriptional regulator